jgi:hypothetical protein
VGGEYLIYMILKNKTEYEFRSWIQIYRWSNRNLETMLHSIKSPMPSPLHAHTLFNNVIF